MTTDPTVPYGEDAAVPLMRVLTDFDRFSFCSTPLCGGAGGLDFEKFEGDWVAETHCGCGSQNSHEILSDQDVLHLLRSGFYAIQALGALVDAYEKAGEVPVEYHAHTDALLDTAMERAKHALAVAKVVPSGGHIEAASTKENQ